MFRWSFSIGRGGQQKTWSWAEFRALPSQDVTVDIHCVTKWSKLDTAWQAVSVDTLVDLAGMSARSRYQRPFRASPPSASTDPAADPARRRGVDDYIVTLR